jgi:hypothetical protein
MGSESQDKPQKVTINCPMAKISKKTQHKLLRSNKPNRICVITPPA